MEARNLASLIKFTSEFKDRFEGRSPNVESVLWHLHELTVQDIYECGGRPRTHMTDAVAIKAKFEPADATDVILKVPLLLERARNWPSYVETSLKRNPTMAEQAIKIMLATDNFYDFLIIHPFREGNGRVARAWLHLMLYDMEVFAPPLEAYTAMAYRRDQYFNVLKAADRGDRGPLYRYVTRAIWQSSIDNLCSELASSEGGKYLESHLPTDSTRFLTRPQTRMASNDEQLKTMLTNLGRDIAKVGERASRNGR